MVDLVIEESDWNVNGRREKPVTTDEYCSTSTMLEPTTRLPTSSDLVSNQRDISSFICSVQPNRSLPLRPAPPLPRRKSASVICAAATTHQKPSPVDELEKTFEIKDEDQLEENKAIDKKLISHTQDKGIDNKDVEDNSEFDDPLQIELNQELDFSESLWNSIDETISSSNIQNTTMCLPSTENISVAQASGKEYGGNELVPAKTVPSIRLKKISKIRDKLNRKSISPLEMQKNNDQLETIKESSEYVIATEEKTTNSTEIANETSTSNCSTKSIEITIPSVPELGIKETRTDKINLPQETTLSKSFIVNYILGEDAQSEAKPINTQISKLSPLKIKNLNSEDHEKHTSSLDQKNCNYSKNKYNDRFLSMFFHDSDDSSKVTFNELYNEYLKISSIKKQNWSLHRQQLRKKFRELRSKVMDLRQKTYASVSLIVDNNTQKNIDNYDQRINHYSNILRKLHEVNTSSKFTNFFKEIQESLVLSNKNKLETKKSSTEILMKIAKKMIDLSSDDFHFDGKNKYDSQSTMKMTSETSEETPKDYLSVNEVQNFEKIPEKTIVSPKSVEVINVLNSKRKIQLCSNEYSTTSRDFGTFNEKRVKKVMESMSISPFSNIVTKNQTRRGSKIDSYTCNSGEPLPQNSKEAHSPFIIDQLSIAPRSTTILPTATLPHSNYPLHSQETVDAQTLSKSPREAVIATTISNGTTDLQKSVSEPTTAITSMSRNQHQHYYHHEPEYYQVHQRSEPLLHKDNKKQLDSSAKNPKRQTYQEKYNQLLEKEDERKRRRVSEAKNHLSMAYSQTQQAKAQSLLMDGQHELHARESNQMYPFVQEAPFWNPINMLPQNFTEKLGQPLDYQIAAHNKQTNPRDYTLSMQRMHGAAATAEQAKIRDAIEARQFEVPVSSQSDASQIEIESGKPASQTVTGKGSRKSRNMHIMTEQFPTLGKWVAALVGKQGVDDSSIKNTPSVDNRQMFYQSANSGPYKPTNNFGPSMTAVAPNNYTATDSASMLGKWTMEQQQREQISRELQQMQVAGAPYYPRQQNVCPPLSPILLSYSAKYPMDMCQKSSLLGYNSLYPYSRLPLDSSVVHQRASHILPFAGGHRIPVNPNQRPIFPNLDYASMEAAQQAQYASILAAREASTYENQQQQQQQKQQQQQQQQKQQQQQQRTKSLAPEMSRGNVGKQFKSSGTFGQNQRNEIVADSNSTTLAPMCTSTNEVSPKQQQQNQKVRQRSVALKNSEGNYQGQNVAEIKPRYGNYQNLHCSNCSSIGSRFECLGCGTAVYCNETCQSQHWALHVLQCLKIMPKLKKVDWRFRR